jgi:HEAT repeat protein
MRLAALTQIADPASADRLGDALKDPDWRVRMGAALALTAIGDEKSVSYLEIATRDENEFVLKNCICSHQKKRGKTSFKVNFL